MAIFFVLHVLVVPFGFFFCVRTQHTTRTTEHQNFNTAADQRAWVTSASYSTATLPSSSSRRVMISHGHVCQVYMLLYWAICFFLTRDRSSRNNTPLSLLLLRIIAVCDLTLLSLLRPCSTLCANSSRERTMYMWKIRAVLSVLQQAVVFVVVFGILAYARTCCMQCVTGSFYSAPIIAGSQQIIPTSTAYSKQHSFKSTLSYGLLCARHC